MDLIDGAKNTMREYVKRHVLILKEQSTQVDMLNLALVLQC